MANWSTHKQVAIPKCDGKHQFVRTDKSVPAGGSASVGDQFLPFPPPTSRYYRNMERKHFSRLAACGQMACFICQS
ncbi:hypothetical protein T4D_8666 [Trichinella pseudospiralis]|uniref:Uncharacterized protein n=1 Tax=Trichinella pseudospiralis TaxID=6337 RepID=A0A0V1FHL4_TRIPS|nr:hypothetical protein T4D_8666 [Trichinella pseudospiralis]